VKSCSDYLIGDYSKPSRYVNGGIRIVHCGVLLWAVLASHGSRVCAETQHLYGFRPQISITKDISDRWDFNVFSSNNSNLNDKAYGNTRFPADIQQYFQTGPIYKYGPNLNFVFLGYIYQRTNPFSNDFVNENRLFQQVVYGTDTIAGQLTHRLRFEERFIHDRVTGRTPFSTRLRYQVALLVPLQGAELDAGELYLNVYNEFYFNTTGSSNTFYSENWSYAGIGYQTAQHGRMEVGPLIQRSIINRHDVRYIELLQINWSYNF
jgi:hypothetical protein